MFRRRWQRQKISASPKRIGAGEFSILGGGGKRQRPTFSSAAGPVRGAAAGPGRCPAAREGPQRPWRARFLSSRALRTCFMMEASLSTSLETYSMSSGATIVSPNSLC